MEPSLVVGRWIFRESPRFQAPQGGYNELVVSSRYAELPVNRHFWQRGSFLFLFHLLSHTESCPTGCTVSPSLDSSLSRTRSTASGSALFSPIPAVAPVVSLDSPVPRALQILQTLPIPENPIPPIHQLIRIIRIHRLIPIHRIY